MNKLQRLRRFLALEPENVSPAEKLVSTLGGFTGIFLIAWISYQVTGASGAALIVPSMGASAVLLFAVPHGRLSQPWALIGGHLISALIGVSCYQWIPDTFLAAGLAVGLAIGAMHLLGCIHPPGGATALAAVIGGPAIHALGYQYALTPIGINTLVILVTAIVFNSLFPWRRYPVSLMRFTEAPPPPSAAAAAAPIDRRHIEQALNDMDLIVDLTTEDLERLFTLALEHAERQRLTPEQIRVGHFYTNGRHGAEWAVREVIDEDPHEDPEQDLVVYRTVEGRGLHSADSCTRREFARWAARELLPAQD
ncbi:HPP family protein [Thiohalobacter sp. IOR34]|uniref:HPP family protein n=1 Tax=Thiohalobacter sp. IOR34 TaxID=3057176 RepID=UPI0025B082B6|nr:HPP family protein [Thiohalobacter sp. IOR34]WJW74886.1 HPP family protein [Thiohalobacter sp. IOR34]